MPTSLQQAADRLFVLMSRLRQLSATTPPPEAAKISPSLMAIVDFVATSPNCGIKEIARGLKLSTPTVSVSVRQLEGAELIARRPNPNDGRAVLLSLTPKGRELHDQTHVFRRQTFEKLLSGLTPEERDIMLTLMEKALDLTESNYHPHSHVMEITT